MGIKKRKKRLSLRGIMVSEIKNKVTLHNALIEEAFDVKKTSNYHLIMLVGLDGILIAVNDTVKNKFLAFEKHVFQNVHSFKVVSDLLEHLFKTRKILPNTYKKTTVVISNSLSTLIPNPLFAEENANKYLKFNVNVENNDDVLWDDLKTLEAKNIFAIPKELRVKVNSLYTNVRFHHSSSALIESLLIQNKNLNKKNMYVHLQASHFEVVLVEGKKIIFYNSFSYHSSEDFIYYLLFACEQVGLNPENAQIVLLGEIEKKSSLYAVAQKYIRNIRFGERCCDVELGYQLQEIPGHFYYSILNNYLL